MYITTSKNASKELVATAKLIGTSLPYIKYISRSERSLETLCKIISKTQEESILVLIKKLDDNLLLKYSKTKEGWNWENKGLKISEIHAKQKDIETPYAFQTKTDKEIADFLGLQDQIHSQLYDDVPKIKIESKQKKLSISHEKDEILKFKYEWVEWQK